MSSNDESTMSFSSDSVEQARQHDRPEVHAADRAATEAALRQLGMFLDSVLPDQTEPGVWTSRARYPGRRGH